MQHCRWADLFNKNITQVRLVAGYPLSANEVDDDEVEDDVGKDKVGKPTLSADPAELALVGRIHLNSNYIFHFHLCWGNVADQEDPFCPNQVGISIK